jgi:twinkle protein
MSEIPEAPAIEPWSTGFEAWDNKVYLAAGKLSVVTGHPGHGKTQLFTQIWFQICEKYDLVAAVASFETEAKPELQRQLRTLHAKMPEYWLLRGRPGSSEEEKLKAADSWIERHYLWLSHPERRPDLTWLLSQAEIAVIRHKAKILVIDPWNRLEATREGKETETEYIGRALRALYNFARDFNVHVQVMAHPAKADGHRRGMPPELEDISGSKNWDNMCDQGFVIHRPKMFDEETEKRETYCEFYYKKTRFKALGYPCKLGLEYDVDQDRYGTCKLTKKETKKKATVTVTDVPDENTAQQEETGK